MTEKARAEKEAKRSELGAERENIAAEIAKLEQGVIEADQVLVEVATMKAQGELDSTVQETLKTITQDAEAKKQEFDALESRLAEIDQEIATLEGLEGGEAAVAPETAAAMVEEKPADQMTEAPAELEKPIGATTETQMAMQETIPDDIFKEKTYQEATEMIKNMLGINPQTRIRDLVKWSEEDSSEVLRSNASYVRESLSKIPEVAQQYIKKMEETGQTQKNVEAFKNLLDQRMKEIEASATQMEDRAKDVEAMSGAEKSTVDFSKFDLTGATRKMKQLMEDSTIPIETLKAAGAAFYKKALAEGASPKFLASFQKALAEKG